jgi:hypothetical protein
MLAVAALLAAALLLVAPPAAGAWARPVRGELTRGFDFGVGAPFRAGLHRGVDFQAPPGTRVRAACGGRVVVAGRVGASGGVVTVACGRWRVSLLSLERIAVRAGAHVGEGDAIGVAGSARGHAGIHLGVRRAGSRFGYVDPLPFLSDTPAAPPPAVGPRGTVRRPRPAPRLAPLRPVAAPRAIPARPLAPPLAWAGLALLLTGAAGAGAHRARTRRPAPGSPAAPACERERGATQSMA